MISADGSNLESWVAIVSSESFADSSHAGIVERHVLCAQSPIIPYASRLICHSVWQQSVAVFDEFWKHKLIDGFSYCLQNINTIITLQCHHCHVKLVLLFLNNKN